MFHLEPTRISFTSAYVGGQGVIVGSLWLQGEAGVVSWAASGFLLLSVGMQADELGLSYFKCFDFALFHRVQPGERGSACWQWEAVSSAGSTSVSFHRVSMLFGLELLFSAGSLCSISNAPAAAYNDTLR